MNRPAQELLHQVAGHPVVAVEVVEAAGEGVRQAQGADEVPHGDLAVAHLAFQGAVPVDLEGVEKDLAVGRFDHEVLIFAIHGLVHGDGLGILIRTHPQSIDPRVLGSGCVFQEGQGHATSASLASDRRSAARAGSAPSRQDSQSVTFKPVSGGRLVRPAGSPRRRRPCSRGLPPCWCASARWAPQS